MDVRIDVCMSTYFVRAFSISNPRLLVCESKCCVHILYSRLLHQPHISTLELCIYLKNLESHARTHTHTHTYTYTHTYTHTHTHTQRVPQTDRVKSYRLQTMLSSKVHHLHITNTSITIEHARAHTNIRSKMYSAATKITQTHFESELFTLTHVQINLRSNFRLQHKQSMESSSNKADQHQSSKPHIQQHTDRTGWSSLAAPHPITRGAHKPWPRYWW